MIWMQHYWTKVDHAAEPGLMGRYPVVPGAYTRKDGPVSYSWDSCMEFMANNGTSHDHIANVFGGHLFTVNAGYFGIRSYQLFKDENDFMELIHAPWLVEHTTAVKNAWAERERIKFYHHNYNPDDEDSSALDEANNRWVALRMLKEEELEKMYE